MTDLIKKIIAAAVEYRKFGWNVIPLCGYSKNPASSPYVKSNGWLHLQEQTLGAEDFKAAFNIPDLTGVGMITGAISRTVVIDEDSYKADGKKVELESPMVSQSASGGRHIFGKYSGKVRSIGFHKGINVEVKSDGGFLVLPPSQVYRKDEEGKQTKEIGEYKWLTQCAWEMLPVFSEEQMKPFRAEDGLNSPALSDFINSHIGIRHPELIRLANSLFNKYSEKDWDIAGDLIRAINEKHPDPKPQKEVEDIIRDAKNFVKTHPKQYGVEVPAVRTAHIEYGKMSDEQIEKKEEREELVTGLTVLDELLPFKAGYYVCCGNPGSGKGWFAIWLGKQFFIMHRKKSVLFSLEMSEPLVRTRLLQQWSQLTEEQLGKGASVVLAKELMKQDAMTVYPFGQEDTAYQTPENFRKDIEMFYGLGYRVFFFDHLHELEGTNDNTRNQKVVEEWGKAFQTLCKDFPDIWLFVFAQPNGAAASKLCLGRTDIAGSKSITQKCEVFVSLNRKLLPKVGQLEQMQVNEQDRGVLVWVDKNRLSSRQKVGKFVYLSRTGNFTEYLDTDVLPDEKVFPTNQQIDLLKKDEKREIN